MKKVKIAIVFMIMILLAACDSTTSSWQEKYDLGMRYLSEENYEEAILAFSAAIEIDKKKAESYVGRGDAYCGKAKDMGNQENIYDTYKKAISDYEKAVELGCDSIEDKLEKVQRIINGINTAIENEELLGKLYDCFVTKDMDQVKNILSSDAYSHISDKAEDGYVLYSRGEDKSLAVYKKRHCYFGDFVNGQREGNGIWASAKNYNSDRRKKYLEYNGQWENDMPNGKGTTIEYIEGVHLREIECEVKDGLYHGTAIETFHDFTHAFDNTFTTTYINGVQQSRHSPYKFGVFGFYSSF